MFGVNILLDARNFNDYQTQKLIFYWDFTYNFVPTSVTLFYNFVKFLASFSQNCNLSLVLFES